VAAITVALLVACASSTPEVSIGVTTTPSPAATAPATPTPPLSAPLTSVPTLIQPTATSAPSPTPTPAQPPAPTLALDTAIVTVGEGRFTVEVADDPGELTRGLSYREALPADAGMWFDMGVEDDVAFWMFEMRFPIDIVWISEDLAVVDVTHEAPAPDPGAEPSDLPLYSPDVPARYVLEINGGLARALGIESGILVAFEDGPA
jgi:uncharacterized membrane protein (UPF0127 family)